MFDIFLKNEKGSRKHFFLIKIEKIIFCEFDQICDFQKRPKK